MLALEALLDHVEVEQPEEPAAEPETERRGGFALVGERRVVQRQSPERRLELAVFVGGHRIDRAEHHGTGLAVSGQRGPGGTLRFRHGVPDRDFLDPLDAADGVTDRPGGEHVHRFPAEPQQPDLFHHVVAVAAHEPHPVSRPHFAVHHPDEQHDAAVGVVLGVEDERPQGIGRIAARRGHALHHGVEDLLDPLSLLRGGEDDFERIESELLVNLLAHPFRVGGGQVHLVDDRNHLQVVFHRHEVVGDGLRLDSLGRVHEEERSLAGHQRTPDLVGEVHVARGVNQVELVGLPVLRLVEEGDAVRLDGDAALALEVHRVEQLVPELAVADAAAALDQPVGERGFPVINVRDDAEVADPLDGRGAGRPTQGRAVGTSVTVRRSPSRRKATVSGSPMRAASSAFM